MMNRMLSVSALLILAGTTTLTLMPTVAAGPLPCQSAADAVYNAANWFDGETAAELQAWLEDLGCPADGIAEALCTEFGGVHCPWLVHDVLGTDIDHLVKPIYEGDHAIKAAGVTIVGSGKGVQYKDTCGTNLERQLNCRTTATLPALPSLPTLPGMPAPPPWSVTVYSPFTLSVGAGDIVIVWPSQVTVALCEFWPGDLNCS